MLSPRRETRRRTCITQTFTSAASNPMKAGAPAPSPNAVDGAIRLTPLGLEGDEQAEKLPRRAGPRAVPLPARALCPLARAVSGAGRAILRPGLRREYLHRRADRTQCVYGRHLPLGRSADPVTQPRSPCYKLNYHFAIEDISVLMQQSGRCGWLYRVVSPGAVSGDRPLALAARNSDVSVAEAIAIARTCRSTRNSIAVCWRWPASPPAGARPCSRGSPKGALRISTAACSAVESASGK